MAGAKQRASLRTRAPALLRPLTYKTPIAGHVPTRKEGLMKTTLMMLLFVAAASPALADPHRANRAEPGITCETVRAYVSQVGLLAAKAVARANGMTASQERRARQCLASRD